MKDYSKIKNVLKENREKIIFVISAILIFFMGFGVGESRGKKHSVTPIQSQYTTKTPKEQPKSQEPVLEQKPNEQEINKLPEEKKNETSANPKVEGQTTMANTSATQNPANCPVKGNISSDGRKIYHIPGGSFYKRVKAEMCFKTEDEATVAGFKKSGK